jgi:signal transduction histidine kinase
MYVRAMKKYTSIVCLVMVLLAAAGKLTAQRLITGTHYADSLEALLGTRLHDTARAGIMQNLSNYYVYTDSAKAMLYAQQSLKLSTAGHDNFHTALAHFFIGNVYMEHDNLDKGEQELLTAEKMLRSDPSVRSLKYQARIWHNYGAICQRRDDSRKFLDIMLNKTAPLLEKAGDSATLALTYKDIGLVFMNYKEYDKALEYYNKTINRFRGNLQYEDLASCYCYAAQTLLMEEKGRFDSAGAYLARAQQILQQNSASQEWLLYYTVNGMYYYYRNQPEKALENYDKGLALAARLKALYPSLNMLMGKFKIYNEQKNYPQAKRILYELYDKTKPFPISGNKLTLLSELAAIEEKTGNIPAAYRWLSQYSRLSDSLNEENNKLKIDELETKYQTARKEKEIVSLQAQARQQQLGLQHHRFVNYLLLSGLVILLLLLLVVFLLYRSKQRLAQQQALAHQQKLKEMEQAQQLSVYNAMLQGQEQERNRVARDLHDGLGGMLAGVKLKLSAIAGKEEQQKPDMELYKVITQLDQSVQELRRIARNMMPETLLQFGLQAALKDLCDSMQTTHMHIEFQAYGLAADIPQQVQITIYRIVQELLSNAIRHAGASNILVQCSQNENIVFITVEDDGRGFDEDLQGGKKGIGLSNIRNRVNFLKGKVDIRSVPGEGTTVNVEVNTHVNE